MAEKIVKSRVQVKRGTSSDWQKAETTFQPLEGEIIFYTDLNKIKIGKKIEEGDLKGELFFLKDLPFLEPTDTDIKLSSELKTYYNVGKIKNASGTNPVVIGNAGDSLRTVFNNLFNMDESQPTITSQPSITLSLSSSASDEIGTKISSLSYSISTEDGAYTNASTTGVTWSDYQFTGSGFSAPTSAFTSKTGTVTLSSDYVVGVSSDITLTVKGNHSAGNVAKTNLGNNSNPEIKIAAGSKSDDYTFSKTSYYYTYYAVTDSTTAPTAWTPVGSTSTSDISISANTGQYIWIASSNSSYTGICEYNQLSEKYNVAAATVKTSGQTLTNTNDYTCTGKYTFYRLEATRAASGTSKFKLN